MGGAVVETCGAEGLPLIRVDVFYRHTSFDPPPPLLAVLLHLLQFFLAGYSQPESAWASSPLSSVGSAARPTQCFEMKLWWVLPRRLGAELRYARRSAHCR